MAKPILIFGATGGTGSELVKLALDAGLAVRAFVRTPGKMPAELLANPALEIVQSDLTDLAAIDRAIQGVDIVVSTAGNKQAAHPKLMTHFVEQAVDSMHRHGVKRFIYQGGAFTLMPGETLPASKRFVKWLFGTALRAAPTLRDNDTVVACLTGEGSDLNWTLTRPGWIRKAS